MNELLLSFQVTFLLIALLYAIKIKNICTTPNLPYKIAIITIALMAGWRIGKLFGFITIETATVTMVFITFLWMCFFINIYTLIKRKNG